MPANEQRAANDQIVGLTEWVKLHTPETVAARLHELDMALGKTLDEADDLRALVVEAYDDWGSEGCATNVWRIKAEKLNAWPEAKA